MNSSATDCEMSRSDNKDSGWKVKKKEGNELLIPIWDTDDGHSKINGVKRSLPQTTRYTDCELRATINYRRPMLKRGGLQI